MHLPISHKALIVEIARRAARAMGAPHADSVRALVLWITHRHADAPLDLHGLRYAPEADLLASLDLVRTA